MLVPRPPFSFTTTSLFKLLATLSGRPRAAILSYGWIWRRERRWLRVRKKSKQTKIKQINSFNSDSESAYTCTASASHFSQITCDWPTFPVLLDFSAFASKLIVLSSLQKQNRDINSFERGRTNYQLSNETGWRNTEMWKCQKLLTWSAANCFWEMCIQCKQTFCNCFSSEWCRK